MISPGHFGFNKQTANTNSFQHEISDSETEVQNKALHEFNEMVDKLKKVNINVLVLSSRKDVVTPDSIFPNNWFSHHQKEQACGWDDSTIEDFSPLATGIFKDCEALRQVGTLGGGNHFIEIGYDENDSCWIIIHSGSRGFGWKVAQAYMKLASPSGKASEGHFGFRTDSTLGEEYIADMNGCLEFALTNRLCINRSVYAAIKKFVDCVPSQDDVSFINRNHNHAVLKNGLWIHRKGATHAEEGMMGVIPGNMRDGSFIVEGKGNPESLWSSSHGAGRVSSRKAIKESTNVVDFEVAMRGIKAKVNADTLDESPFAYKNIFDVMLAQKDLVEIVHRVRPLINVKGVTK